MIFLQARVLGGTACLHKHTALVVCQSSAKIGVEQIEGLLASSAAWDRQPGCPVPNVKSLRLILREARCYCQFVLCALLLLLLLLPIKNFPSWTTKVKYWIEKMAFTYLHQKPFISVSLTTPQCFYTVSDDEKSSLELLLLCNYSTLVVCVMVWKMWWNCCFVGIKNQIFINPYILKTRL